MIINPRVPGIIDVNACGIFGDDFTQIIKKLDEYHIELLNVSPEDGIHNGNFRKVTIRGFQEDLEKYVFDTYFKSLSQYEVRYR